MPLTRLLTAAGFAALLAGAAHAQTVDPTIGPERTVPYTATTDADAKAAAAQELGVEANALVLATDRPAGTVSTELVTNGPVPDTPENRARFGGPMSRAGQATTPAGN